MLIQRDLALDDAVVEARLVELFLHLGHAQASCPSCPACRPYLSMCSSWPLRSFMLNWTLLEALHHALGCSASSVSCAFSTRATISPIAEDAASRCGRARRFRSASNLLAQAHEADRLAGDRAHRERGTAAAVPRPSWVSTTPVMPIALVEVFRRGHGVLAGQAIDRPAGFRGGWPRRGRLRPGPSALRRWRGGPPCRGGRRRSRRGCLRLGASGDGDRVFRP